MALHYSSTSSTSSSSMSPQARHPRRLLTEQDIRRNLEILGTISRPLSPTLPPSPPLSPRPLPASLKRKREPSVGPDEPESKRHHHDRRSEQPPKRYSKSESIVAQAQQQHSSPNGGPVTPQQQQQPPPPALPSSPSPPPQYKPGLPPRKRKGPMPRKLADEFQASYAAKGKALKKSGELHVAIGHPTDPSLSDAYRRQRVRGTLEVTFALICFAFSFWLDEFKQGKPGMHWRSMRLLMEWTRPHWEKHAQGPKERAFLGFLYMLETFIEFRVQRQRMSHTTRCLDDQLKGRSNQHLHPSIPSPLSSQPTPPTDNASPAASSPSSNSTARGGGAHHNPSGTPTSSTNHSTHASATSSSSNSGAHSGSSHLPAAAPTPEATPQNLSIPVVAAQSMVAHLNYAQQLSAHHHHARYLSLPILQMHYPRTFHRVTGLVPSTGPNGAGVGASANGAEDFNLQLYEELEIHDLESEEEAGGDFPYPSSSDGLVWVLLLGRSMIAELLSEGAYPVVAETPARS